MIIEENKENLSAILAFVDFRKDFDSIHRGEMMYNFKSLWHTS
jgi:hypothetical protein